MRVIEREMNNAISTETDWQKDNTQVINIEGVSFVYLFNNLIAMVGDTWLELFDGGYKSATTKSRLNAILKEHGNSESVYQKNFEWFVSTKYGDIPFNNGIKLNWTKMTELLAILIPGAIVIGTPFLIAKALKIKLFTDTNSYDDGFVDGYILGEYDDWYSTSNQC